MNDDNYDQSCAVTAEINTLVADFERRGIDKRFIATILEKTAAKINEEEADGLLNAFGRYSAE